MASLGNFSSSREVLLHGISQMWRYMLCKEVIVTCLKYYPNFCLEGSRKTAKVINLKGS
jgi:hypothetical protein